MGKPKDDLIEEPGEGHNSLHTPELKKIIQELEDLHEQKANISADIKSVMEVAKQKGFEARAIRNAFKVKKLKEKLGEDKYQEQQDLDDLYLSALGLI